MLPGTGQAREEENEDQLMMEAGSGPGMEAVIRASLAASGPSHHQGQVELLDLQFKVKQSFSTRRNRQLSRFRKSLKTTT